MKRRSSGATLAFVAGSIIFIVIVALAFYFLSQLLGGARELQSATDSGTLNVAKQSLVQQVDIPAPPNDDLNDMKTILQGQLPTTRVDLRSFNSLVGAAMLVSMNADADGNSDALKNARTFIDLIEGQDGGYGGPSTGKALQQLLSTGDGWAKTSFDQTANRNSLRMLGDSPDAQWQAADFRVGYYNADQPTNIALNYYKTDTVNNLPYNNVVALGESLQPTLLMRSDLPMDAAKKDNATGDTLLLGYHGISTGAVGRQLFGVPLDTQPHLVSLTQFGSGAATQQPGAGSVAIPPNAFMNGATGRDSRKSNKDVHMLAAAVAGSNAPPVQIALTNGYIVLDNHLSKAWTGLIPTGDTVFAQELGNQGITVDDKSGYFERGDNHQVEDWQNTPRDQDKNGNMGKFDPASDGPAWDKIFTNTGDAPKSAQQVSDNIPYKGGNTSCNHSNSDIGSPAPAPQCIAGTTSPSPDSQCPFDKALHPNPNKNQPSNPLILTATEQTGCKVMDLWAKATTDPNQKFADFHIDATGIGLYPQNHNPIQGQSAPWTNSSSKDSGAFPNGDGDSYSDPNVPCKVTKPGNFAQLIDQTMGQTPDFTNGKPVTNAARGVAEIIKQRMHEILPADNATIDNEFNNVAFKPIPLGSTLFIYLDPKSEFKHFKSDTSAPPWLNTRFNSFQKHFHRYDPVTGSKVDGRDVVLKDQAYGVAMNMADAKHQWGIHDTPFIHINGEMVVVNANQHPNQDSAGNGSIVAHDKVYVNTNSGVYGNLLNVTFQETTDASGGGGPGGPTFTDRD